ncbi:MAG: pyridoxine 5'-phosphate synthase [Methylococcales bacterium]
MNKFDDKNLAQRPPMMLGVNIDHVATLRQARMTRYPEPVQAALIAEQAGADGITAHLREDRRHIQDRDIRLLQETIHSRLNLEMAVTLEMVRFAREIRPQACCLVPEKREELTTEGGLDVKRYFEQILSACLELASVGCQVSLFIDPDVEQIDVALKTGAPVIELHTGCYANAGAESARQTELDRLRKAATYAYSAGLQVNAGHGIDYHNVAGISRIPEIVELNIGHSIIARALIAGLESAVRDMKRLITESRRA